MGDGLTDAARDTRRYECLVRYLTAIHTFLLDRTEPNRIAVRFAAEATERADRGTVGRYGDSTTCRMFLDGLTSGDESVWFQILEWSRDLDIFDALHAMSPFRNMILLFGRTVHYGCGVDIDMRQLRRFIVQTAESQDGLGERFCISLPFPEPGTMRIINEK